MSSIVQYIRLLFAAAVFLTLTGCVTIDVAESKVFRPHAKLSATEKGGSIIQNDFVLTAKYVNSEHFTREASFGDIAMSKMTRAENSGKPLVLTCMGTSADRYHSGRYYTQKSIDYGDVILYDYPGYNESDGSAKVPDFIESSDVIAQYLRDIQRQSGRPIIAFGHSLGGVVCADMVSRNPDLFDGIIIETSAQNIDQVVKARTPGLIGFLLKPRVTAVLQNFDVALALQQFDGPILLMGGKKDKVLKVELTHTLYDALVQQSNDVTLQIFEESGHENIYKHPNYQEVMRAFYSQFEIINEVSKEAGYQPYRKL